MTAEHPMRKTIVAVLSLLPAIAAAAPESYTFDPRHTFPRWAASHFGFSTHYGQFNKTTGKLMIDWEAKTGSVDIEVETASVAAHDEKFEAHLKSADFFDVEKYPRITFKNTHMTFEGDVPVSIRGDFTLRGVTRPMTLRIASVKCGMHPVAKKHACGADISGSLKRSEFGMKYGLPGIGDEVRLMIQFEAYRD
jgi:polyisoprenoid-binding protein YceI